MIRRLHPWAHHRVDVGWRAAWSPLVLAALLAACTVDPWPLVGPGEVVVDDPAVGWVRSLAWSDDASSLALTAEVDGGTRAYRADLGDASTLALPLDALAEAVRLRFLPGGSDLLVLGRADPAPPGPCATGGIVVVRGAAPVATVACPYRSPEGVFDDAMGDGFDPEGFVAVDPLGLALASGTEDGIQLVDLATFEARGLGPGTPVAFDPSGTRLLVVEASWGLQSWSTVAIADGARTPLPVDERVEERGFHVVGARWTDAGVLLIVERLLPDGRDWALWNLTTGDLRSLGPVGDAHEDFPSLQPPRWTLDGRYLAFATTECLRPGDVWCWGPWRHSVVVVDLDNDRRWTAYRGEPQAHLPVAAPDGSAVAYLIEDTIYLTELR